ncbi:exonuclease domain-containing protein [uncultured Oscillibacter sp.]|uniref:exonuclease domain-containing protein n=1 Tax=uncultured Oscillibacter sp. TaxID=876091 RepID=UPI0025DE9DE3|nr:exonuclease domain-containing protein [uncultured Oscillibacter sp.]
MERYDFITIDFETANHNYDSACSIGIAAVRDSEIVDTYYSLIKPNSEFDSGNIRIHGITPEDVKRAPTPYDVWRDIFHFFGHYAVLAHNAFFDMSVLKRSFPFIYNTDFKYIDTVSLCKEFVPGKKSLVNCANFFNINLGQHHNGLDDAITCAKLAISCIESSQCKNLGELCFSLPNVKIYQFSDLNPSVATEFHKEKRIPTYSNIRPCDIERTADISSIDPKNPFFGKTIVFTGDLCMSRAEAMQAVINMGASVKTSVSRKVDYLVVGKQDISLVGEDGTSTKEKKAAELNWSGKAHIEILRESQFLSIMQREVYDGRF